MENGNNESDHCFSPMLWSQLNHEPAATLPIVLCQAAAAEPAATPAFVNPIAHSFTDGAMSAHPIAAVPAKPTNATFL